MISVISAVAGGKPTPKPPRTLETVISDLLKGEYSDPVRVVGFNTAEGWSRDVSEGVASELQHRCERQGNDVPANLEAFIERHAKRDRRQLTLRLV
jgi:hypothetical protein